MNLVNPVEKDFEYCFSEFLINNKRYVFVCIYRSPSRDTKLFFGNLIELLDKLYCPTKFYVISGDFNFHFHDPNDNDALSLVNILSSYGLKPHISGYTRVMSGQGSSQLDNIFSNVNEESVFSEIYTTNISDHFGQIIKINNIIKLCHNQTFMKKRFFNDQNLLRFLNYLSEITWDEVYLAQGASEKYTAFYRIFYYYFDLSFPVSTTRVKPEKACWVNTEIRNYSGYIKDLYVWYKQTNSQVVYDTYRSERKAYRKYLSNYHRSINDNRIINSKNKTKTAWGIFNSECNKTAKNLDISLKINDLTVEDPLVIAELFGGQFNLPFTPLTNYNIKNQNNYPTIFLDPVDAGEIFKELMNLPNKYSSGLDEIPVYVLKFVALFISNPLENIINESFITHIFPSDLKKAKLVPVYKKGDRQCIANYRPISLLPAVSKVIEKVINARLVQHLSVFHILSNNQFGFRPNRSCEMAIFKAISYITDQIDKNKKVSGLYFDLSRAFDTVDHKLLLNKLNSYGIRGAAACLIESYLSGRQQTVCISRNGNQYYSNTTEIRQGVPQGSVLGPLLFLLYVNELGSDLGGGVVCQFADDTSVILADASVAGLSRDCSGTAEMMCRWCTDNHLTLNSDKTGLILFNKTPLGSESLLVRLNGKSIPSVNHIKFLGLHLDPTLDWEHHISILKSKLNSLCFIVRRLRDVVSRETLKLFYFGQIQSIIAYGICFWGSSKRALGIFRMQKRIIRCIFNLHPRTSCGPYFNQFGVLTVPSLYFSSLVLFVKRNHHLFPVNSQQYTADMVIETRGRNDLRIPLHRSTFYERGPYYRAIKAYRLLPNSIRLLEGVHCFKKQVTRWLLDRCLYSFNF